MVSFFLISHSIAIGANNEVFVVDGDNVERIGEVAWHRTADGPRDDEFLALLLPMLVFAEARIDGFHLSVFEQSEAHFAEQAAFGGGFNPCADQRGFAT